MKRLQRDVDFGEFLKVLRREGRPAYLPFYEHFASPGFIARRTETPFDRMTQDDPAYWEIYVDFWLGMGYDCIPMEISLSVPPVSAHVAGSSHGSEAHAVIRNREDFERYPWPDTSSPIDFPQFERAAAFLPDGVKIVGGVQMGPYEWVSQLMGVMGMSFALADDPELVRMMFARIGELHIHAVRHLASLDFIGALRQGDDLGFKSATFLSPGLLREMVFPIYRDMAAEAHAQDKPFILHSCGNLREVYDDLIDYCRIDAKHSFENVIMPVGDFKRAYGSRVTPLGGMDVDFICRSTPEEIRRETRRLIGECFHDGHWALGTGNSLTDYMPVENYIAALEEGMKAGR